MFLKFSSGQWTVQVIFINGTITRVCRFPTLIYFRQYLFRLFISTTLFLLLAVAAIRNVFSSNYCRAPGRPFRIHNNITTFKHINISGRNLGLHQNAEIFPLSFSLFSLHICTNTFRHIFSQYISNDFFLFSST